MKTCTKCKVEKPVSEFRPMNRKHTKKDGSQVHYSYPRPNCRECERADSKKWHSEKGRDYDLLYRYGITSEQYDEMLVGQSGLCGVCGADEPGRGYKYFCVDHDHDCCPSQDKTCGKCVRGLLCHNCNVVLGLVKDDPERLMALAAYTIQNRNILKEVSA